MMIHRYKQCRRSLATLVAGAMVLGAAFAPVAEASTRPVVFVGNNWDGTVNVFDAATYERVGLVNVVPDRSRRMSELFFNPVKLTAFQAVRHLIGEGNDQLVDDMYSSNDGRLLIASRPSFADVVAWSWVAADGITRRAELLADTATGAPAAVIRLQDVRIAPQSPALFELPPGYQRRP